AAKFVGDFKSLAKEADESLAKHKALELEIERLLRAVENAHLKTTYKNLFDSIFVTRTQTKTIIDSLQNNLHNMIYENAKLRAQLFDKVSDQKDTTCVKSENTKFAKQSILGKLPKVGVDNTKTRRPQPRSNTKNDRVPSTSKSSRSKNKEVEVEEHHRKLLLSRNKKHMSSECNNVKLASQNVKSKVVCTMCKQCLISVNHSVCFLNYVNGMTSRVKKQKENVSIKEKQKKQQPKVKKPKKVGSIERLSSPKPSKPRSFLRWSPTGRMFDLKGKIIASSKSESQSDCSKGDNACTSNPLEPTIKRFPNSTFSLVGTIRFENDHVAAILGFGDLQWGKILITRVYFVEGLGYNLFSVGQFCDSDLEEIEQQTFTPSTSMKWPLHPQFASWLVLLPPSHGYGINVYFNTINDLAKNDLVSGLPKFKYYKEHLCPSCEQGKSKRASHPPKPVPNSRQRLHLLHMDLCGPMRIASINEKRYVLVIVDDYSRYTWVHFIRSKDEAPEVIKTFLKRITILLQSLVIIIRTDNGIEFKNKFLKNTLIVLTLVEAARTMLIFSRALLFLWAEAIVAACFTQNRSIIHSRFNKTPYELINGKKPDISFLYVFGALCYPKNDREDIRKLGAKGDIGFFIGYSVDLCAYRVYNQRTKKIMETMNVSSDELSAMAFEQRSLKPGLQSMTSGQISSGLDLTYASSTITTQQPTEDTAPTPTNSSSQATNFPNTSQDVDGINSQQQHAQQQGNQAPIQTETVADNVSNAMFDANTFVNPFATPSTSDAESTSSQYNHFFKGTTDPMLFIRRFVNDILVDSGFELTRFSDADYAGCKDTFKITFGGAQFLGEKLVSWSSKKQDSIAISCNPVQHSRTKHIAVRYHFIKEHVEKGTIELYFVKTDYQLADLFTKALPVDRFNYLVRHRGMRSLSPQELDRLAKSHVIQKINAIVIRDSEETLMLEDESRSKMLQKQKDPMMSEKKVNTKLVDYAALNQLSQDFETRFVPQTELSVKQAFWFRNSVNSEEPNLSTSTTIVEVPKELPKFSMVYSSLKKLKFHLASFDAVVKERTTAIVITEGTNNSFLQQSALTFDQLFEINDLKAQSQEKDKVIMKLKERINSLSGNVNEEKIKRELEEIEMINIELDHRVTKLVAENEHLKQTYKQLYDSIKSSRVRSKEKCDALIKQVNIKSAENSDLNASLQGKVLVITALKDTLSKLKEKAVTLHPIDLELLKINVAPLAPKLRNNRTAHNDYLKHTQEETATLREIV
nr:hypothetical protein [Tanacetum cinerariifolium]